MGTMMPGSFANHDRTRGALPVHLFGGTEGSNPSPSSGESGANRVPLRCRDHSDGIPLWQRRWDVLRQSEDLRPGRKEILMREGSPQGWWVVGDLDQGDKNVR